jgi:hypothetical protein
MIKNYKHDYVINELKCTILFLIKDCKSVSEIHQVLNNQDCKSEEMQYFTKISQGVKIDNGTTPNQYLMRVKYLTDPDKNTARNMQEMTIPIEFEVDSQYEVGDIVEIKASGNATVFGRITACLPTKLGDIFTYPIHEAQVIAVQNKQLSANLIINKLIGDEAEAINIALKYTTNIVNRRHKEKYPRM